VQFTHGAFATPEHVARISQWYDTILQETRRPLIGESIRHRWSEPDLWRKQLDDVEERAGRGAASFAMTSTRLALRRWTLKDSNRLDEMPAWKKVMSMSLEARKQALRDQETRRELAEEVTPGRPAINFSRRWDSVFVGKVGRADHKDLQGKSIEEIAGLQRKSAIDAMLDLSLDEELETVFEDSITQGDEKAVAAIFRSPYVMLGQSDAGAHVASANPGFGFGTFLLGYWVRQRKLMPMEEAIRKLTFMPASIFGIHDRGLLRPGMAADIFVFDPAAIDLERPEQVNDLPEGAPRYIQHARGIRYTIVNGSVLMDNGAHTGAYPGKVLRSQAV
jgi:N-acyl-D-aspartate/D-glutamate deacylase